MKTKRILSLLLVAVLSASLTACGSKSTSSQSGKKGDGEFVIGTSQPLTGTNAAVGDVSIKGAELAIEYLNKNGGVNGEKVRLVKFDDQASPEEGVKLATKLIEVEKVDVVLGSLISSVVLAAGGYFNDAKIPTIGTGLSPTWMAQNWEYVFRATVNNGFSMPATATKMKEMGINKLAIFAGQDDAAKSGSDAMIAACKKQGIQVVATESYVEGDSDFSGQVAKIINTKPDAVFISTFGPTQPMVVKQLRQFGFKNLIFNKETYAVDSIDLSGDAANGVAFLFPYVTYNKLEDVKDESLKPFLEAYYAKYGKMPIHDCAYRSWDAIMVFAEAAKIAGSNDREAIKNAISKIKDFKALAGTLDFTKGDREGMHGVEKGYIVVDKKYSDLNKWIDDGGYKKLIESNK